MIASVSFNHPRLNKGGGRHTLPARLGSPTFVLIDVSCADIKINTPTCLGRDDLDLVAVSYFVTTH